MLRVEILNSADTLTLRLEGRFTGEDAQQTRMLATRCRTTMRLVVDLTDVIFIDIVGEEMLSFFGRLGAEFVAPTSYSLDACERLRLPLAPSQNSHANTSGSTPADPSDASTQKNVLLALEQLKRSPAVRLTFTKPNRL